MEDNTANTLRNTAHEIIIKLMDAERLEALKLLKQHCEAAIAKAEGAA